MAATTDAWIVLALDVASYTARSSETLSPTETLSGRTPVVYDPGLAGAEERRGKNCPGSAVPELHGRTGRRQEQDSGQRFRLRYQVVGGHAYRDRFGNAARSYLMNLDGRTKAKIDVYATVA
ncbi:MAG TPA: hypothetical protein VK436_02310 [Methanocella sp.]|nr:hypothetical protein [Methanocella sp.]